MSYKVFKSFISWNVKIKYIETMYGMIMVYGISTLDGCHQVLGYEVCKDNLEWTLVLCQRG